LPIAKSNHHVLLKIYKKIHGFPENTTFHDEEQEFSMKTFASIILTLFVFSLFACIATGMKEKFDQSGLLYIEGSIQNVTGKEVTVSIKIPDIKKTPGSPISEIAQQVVQKSILIEGIRTEVDGNPATVKKIRGNTALIETEKPLPYTAGSEIKLMIPKKSIAVVDFEVIRGREKETGRMSLEELTSALIDSGQFIVLERSKLKSIMNEIQLSLSGVAAESHEKVAGKMLVADLILTGTFAEMRGEWDVNLRLVNVRTGQAIGAINMKTRLFKPSEIRDSGPLNDDFEESSTDPAWVFMRAGKEAHFQSRIDNSVGVENSKKSLRVDFDLISGVRPFYARIENRKKRDLSLFDGIEFQAKATEKFHAQVTVLTSQEDDPNKIDAWTGFFEVDQKWNKIRIPFDRMVVARGWIKGGALRYGAQTGDQIMRLHRVEAFDIGIDVRRNQDIKGSVWIDRINFYRE